jgi:hypothetical protein
MKKVRRVPRSPPHQFPDRGSFHVCSIGTFN